MSNIITIELCTEDRARIDRLTEALEQMVKQNSPLHVEGMDELQQKLAETMAKASKPAEAEKQPKKAQKAETQANTQPKQEEAPAAVADFPPSDDAAPWEEAPAPAEPKVTHEDIRQKYIALSLAGKKAEAQKIVRQYSDSITNLPEDKLAPVLNQMNALGG